MPPSSDSKGYIPASTESYPQLAAEQAELPTTPGEAPDSSRAHASVDMPFGPRTLSSGFAKGYELYAQPGLDIETEYVAS